MAEIEATAAKYIKLGEKGRWENLCRKDGTLRLGYNEVPHKIALAGDREGVRQVFLDMGLAQGTATSHANQVLDFYLAGPDTVWITFSAGHLWWAVADAPVEFLGGTDEEMAERGSRLRQTRDGWQSTSVGGTPLRIPELSGALTKVVGFQGTICAADPFDYLIRKINDKELPQIVAAKAARTSALESISALARLLHWRDFELLVELIFAQSGWRRIGTSGGTQKTVDIELLLPSTGETAFVQVKSKTDQTQLDDYVSRFETHGDARMFYVYHSAKTPIAVDNKRVVLIGPEKLAEMILEAGLFDWLLNKAG